MVASSVFVNDSVHVLPNPYALTIKPRLEYSLYVSGMILEKLGLEYSTQSKENLEFYSQTDDYESLELKKRIETESHLYCAIEAIKTVKNTLLSVQQISNLAQNLSPLISLIRMVNSNIYHISPQTRHDLVELSTSLGSIVMDSGCLLEATFDFKQTNSESRQIIAELNLIAESKIRKQYPNLNS